MFEYTFVVFFVVLTVGLANPIQGDVSTGPQRCCLPEQFSSTLTTTVSLRENDGTILLTHVSHSV